MAVIVANTPLTLTVPAGFRLQFGTPISGAAVVTLPDRVLTEALTDGEGLGPYQSDASVSITSTVPSTCWTIRRDGPTATLQAAHLAQAPYMPGVSVFIGENASGPAVPAGWSGTQFQALVSGGGNPGAIADSVGLATINTIAINAVLAAGGTVELALPDATYWVNDTLVLYSGSRLITRNGARIKMASGINKSVVVNKAATDDWAAISLAWSAGNQATVTWAGNTLAIGDNIVVDEPSGAGQSQYRGNFLVIGKSGDDLTIMLWRRPTAAPSGTFRAKKSDHDIYVSGDFDYNAAGNPSAAGTDTLALTFTGVKGLEAADCSVYDTKKYCLCVEAVDGARITNLYSPNAASDGFKDYGPSRDVVVDGIRGVFNDDCASVQPREAAAYYQYTRTGGGDCINVRVSNVYAVSTNAGGVVFYGSTNEFADDITFKNIDCITSSQMVKIVNGNGYSNSVNGLIRLKNIAWTRAVDQEVITFDSSLTWRKFELDGFLGNNVAGVAGLTKSPITFNSGFATVMTLRNIRGFIGSNIPLIAVNGTFGASLIDIESPVVNATASNAGLIKLNGTGTVRAVRVRKPKADTFSKFVEIASTMTSAPVITLEDCDLNSAVAVEAAAACKIVLAGGNRFTASTGVVRASGTGTAITIVTSGSNTLASGNWLAKTGTPEITVQSDEFACDITTIARVDGARVRNSNAAANNGTDGAVGTGVFVCVGTASGSWKRLGTAGGANNQY